MNSPHNLKADCKNYEFQGIIFIASYSSQISGVLAFCLIVAEGLQINGCVNKFNLHLFKLSIFIYCAIYKILRIYTIEKVE
jgi:hypothetical protein